MAATNNHNLPPIYFWR